jgi:hypothetical protein
MCLNYGMYWRIILENFEVYLMKMLQSAVYLTVLSYMLWGGFLLAEETVEVSMTMEACRELLLQRNLEVAFSQSGLTAARLQERAERGGL